MKKLRDQKFSLEKTSDILDKIKSLTDYIRSIDKNFDKQLVNTLIGFREVFTDARPNYGLIKVGYTVPFRQSLISILESCEFEKVITKADHYNKKTSEICLIFGPNSHKPIQVYIITYVLNQVFPNNLFIYFSENLMTEANTRITGISQRESYIEISQRISYKDNICNLSRPFKPHEIIWQDPIDLIEMDREKGKKSYGNGFDLSFYYRTIQPIHRGKGIFSSFNPARQIFDPKIDYYVYQEDDCSEGDITEESLERGSYSYPDENSYEKYNGAYGFNDKTIDDAFEGDPENYWNID